MAEKIRTRQYNDLTNWEIEHYLERSDIIVIPVGHCETLGSTPVDGEYVAAHAWATLIAEEIDALVLPNVMFTCAGGTETGKGTIYMSVEDSFHHVLALGYSLFHQGFKRQIYIPSHGPTKMFLNGVVHQLYNDTKCTALYLDVNTYFQNIGLEKKHSIEDFRNPGAREPEKTSDGEIIQRDDLLCAQYQIVGRLHAIPAIGEVDFPPAKESETGFQMAPWYQDECEPLFWCSEIADPAPHYFQNTRQHGGAEVTRYTREELKAKADRGEKYLREKAHKANFQQLAVGMAKMRQYMTETVYPAQSEWLPQNKFGKFSW